MGIAAIIALVGVILGPAITYLGLQRRLSGKIGTSEASDLWEESRNIRKELEERNRWLSDKITQLQKRMEELEAENRALHRENGALQRVIEGQERTIEDLRGRNGRLEERVHELETQMEAHSGT